MTDTDELPPDEAADWFERFENSDAFTTLFEEATQDVTTPDEIPSQTVYDRGETVVVKFRAEEDDGVFTMVVGEYDKATAALETARLQTGQVVGPLAGRGEVWHYEAGELKHGTWIS